MGRHAFANGYQDSVSPLQGDPATSTAGSFGHLTLGDAVIRPFKGFYTQGTATGSKVMVNLGATYGGLRSYSSTTGAGNLLEDFSQTLYYIGAGEVMKEGIPVDEPASTLTFVSGDINTGTGVVTKANSLTTGQPIYITTSSTMPAGWTASTAYFAIAGGGTTFRIASTYKNALAGTPVIPSTGGSGTHTLWAGAGDPLRASSVLQVAANQVATYFYSNIYSAGLGVVDTPTVAVPTTIGASYTGLVNGAVNFKIAAIRDTSNIGANITTPDAPVKGNASAATAVVVPANNTVQITFPAAITGQTHWAVFSTQQGFGGTGVFYRLGYRTSSAASATWIWGIPEATVSAASRVLEFDYRTGDLLPETAWIQDYPPESGTNCVRLENIMVVLGVADGTVASVSLPNYFESFNPFHLLYFPEPVTAVLSRQIDNFAFVACRNSIHTIQYVGYRGDDLPSATVTTITPEIGIAYQQNWCQGAGNIAMWIEGAGIALMKNDGSIDLEFGKEVAHFTKDWTAANVVVSFDPNTRSFVFGHQAVSLSFCLQSGVWSEPVYLSDCGLATSTWTSGVNAQGRLYTTLTASSVATAYKYDDNTGTTRMPVCSVGNWITNQTPARGSGIYEAEATVRVFDTISEPIVMCIHKNLVPTFIRDCSVTSGAATLTAGSNFFVSGATTGSYVAIFSASAIGTAGAKYIIAKATYSSPTVVTLTNPLTGAAVNASASATDCFVLFGAYAYALTAATYQRDQHLPSIRPNVQDARSYCTSVWMASDAATGAVWQVDMFGSGHDTSRVGTSNIG